MFFNNSKNTHEIIDALNKIEAFIKNDINKIYLNSNNCSGNNKIIMDKILDISELMETKQREDMTVYGEIMLSTEKLSDGFTSDRNHKKNIR